MLGSDAQLGAEDLTFVRSFLGTVRDKVRTLQPLIQEAHRAPQREAFTKKDGSFVTATDRAVERAFILALKLDFPNIPIIAEESESERILSFTGSAKDFYQQLLSADYLIVLDPIDGTKNFVHGKREFCFAAALTRRTDAGLWPIAGVVAIPAEDRMFFNEGPILVEERISDGAQKPLLRSEKNVEARVSASSADRSWLESHSLKIQHPWVSSGSSVYDLLGTVSGRLRGSIVGSQRFWDILAPLALANAVGLVLKDLATGERVTSLSVKDLSDELDRRPWGFSRRFVLVPSERAVEEIVQRTEGTVPSQ